MAVITHLKRSSLNAILQDYSVGELQDFSPASQGIENTNYFIRTSAGQPPGSPATTEFVLTVIEDDRLAQRRLMVQILDRCYEYGLPVAPAVRARNGGAISEFQEKAVILSPRLDGNHVVAATSGQCGAIGRFLARMHLATQSLEAEDFPYIRDSDWIESNSADVAKHLPVDERTLLKSTAGSIVAALARKDVRALPRGIIHGDLFRDNALFNEYGLTGIVDFHHCSHGFWLYDLAVAVNDWCRTRDTLDQRRTYELLREYNAIRQLTSEEYWFFPIFLLYAAVAFWLSRLSIAVRDDLPLGYPTKDPKELERVVRRHDSHPFRVHEIALAN